MAWDVRTRNEFKRVPLSATDENRWYGPWDTICHTLWPHDVGFQVCSQYLRAGSSSAPEWTVVYVIKHEEYPVFFVEVKPHFHFDNIAHRNRADNQMRHRFLEFLTMMRVPKLYGLSACGRRFGIWEVDVATRHVIPEKIREHPTLLNDTAPQEWWNYDILEQEAENRLRAIVREMTGYLAPFMSDDSEEEIEQVQ